MSRAASGLGWARINGQQHLRDTLAAAIKDGGHSMASVCREAGIKYGRLYEGLRHTAWLHREDVEKIAAVLDLDPEDLIGPSIFKDDPDVRKWNYRPDTDTPAVEAEPADVQARALCCGCGALRLAPLADWADETQAGDVSLYGPISRFGAPRLIRDLRCDQCHAITRHAFIETREAFANRAEEIDHSPTQEELARVERQQVIDRLATFNVEVHYRPRRKKLRERGFLANYEYDESKSSWRIELDPNAPTRVQVVMLGRIWERISTDSHGDIDWDPKDGVALSPNESFWSLAADELLTDITRFLGVERRRMVQALNDELAQQRATNNRDHDEESWA